MVDAEVASDSVEFRNGQDLGVPEDRIGHLDDVALDPIHLDPERIEGAADGGDVQGHLTGNLGKAVPAPVPPSAGAIIDQDVLGRKETPERPRDDCGAAPGSGDRLGRG